MDRKSSIFIVSFFGYIQVTSHRKVGGKVGKDQGSKQNFKSLSLTSGAGIHNIIGNARKQSVIFLAR
jgi:hypothetical protein